MESDTFTTFLVYDNLIKEYFKSGILSYRVFMNLKEHELGIRLIAGIKWREGGTIPHEYKIIDNNKWLLTRIKYGI